MDCKPIFAVRLNRENLPAGEEILRRSPVGQQPPPRSPKGAAYNSDARQYLRLLCQQFPEDAP